MIDHNYTAKDFVIKFGPEIRQSTINLLTNPTFSHMNLDQIKLTEIVKVRSIGRKAAHNFALDLIKHGASMHSSFYRYLETGSLWGGSKVVVKEMRGVKDILKVDDPKSIKDVHEIIHIVRLNFADLEKALLKAEKFLTKQGDTDENMEA